MNNILIWTCIVGIICTLFHFETMMEDQVKLDNTVAHLLDLK